MTATIIPFTSTDPACRRTLAKLRWVYRDLKRDNKLALHGYVIADASNTDVRRVWRSHGWQPAKRRRA